MLVYYESMKYKDMPYYNERGKIRVKKSYKGYVISFLTSKSLNHAYLKYLNKIDEIDRMISSNLCSQSDKRRLKLDNLFILYLDEIELSQKEESIKKKISTFRCHLNEYKNIRCYEWDNELVKNINYKIKKKEYLNPNIHYRTISLLKDVLKYAKKYDYVRNDLNTDLFDTPKRKRERSERVERCFITYEEFTEIKNGIRKLNNSYYDNISFVFEFLYYTGMRVNEARAIKVSDIRTEKINDIILYYINVERQLKDCSNVVLERLKCDNPKRKVYITDECKNIILNHINNFKLENDNYLFDFYKTNKPIIRPKISLELKELIKVLKTNKLINLEITDCLSPHGLRYSNTEYLLKILKTDLKIAAEIQGHTVKVMLDIYTRINKTDLTNIFGKKY